MDKQWRALALELYKDKGMVFELQKELLFSDDFRLSEWVAMLGLRGPPHSRYNRIRLILKALNVDSRIWPPPDQEPEVVRYSVRVKRIMEGGNS